MGYYARQDRLYQGPNVVPTYPVEIIPGNPFGFRMLYLPGSISGLSDVERFGPSGPTIVGAPTIVGDARGPGWNGVSSNSGARYAPAPQIQPTQQFAVWALFRATSGGVSSGNPPVIGVSYNSTNSAPYYGWVIGRKLSTNAIYGAFNNGTYRELDGAAFTAGTLYSVVLSVDLVNGSQALYINGALAASSAFTGSVSYTATAFMCLGVHPTSADAPGFNILAAGLSFQPLGLQDAAQLGAEPFAMLRPIMRRRYYFVAAGGGPTLLYGRSQILGTSRLAGAFTASAQGRSLGILMSRLQPSLLYAARGQAKSQSTSRALVSPAASLLARSKTTSTARATPSGALGLLGRVASATTSRAAAFFGYILYGRAATTESSRAYLAGSTTLSGRSEAQTISKAQPSGLLGLLGRAAGATTSRASAFFGYILYGRSSGTLHAGGVNTLTLTLSAKTAAASPSRGRLSGLTSLFGRNTAQGRARGSTVNTLTLTAKSGTISTGRSHVIGTVSLIGRAASTTVSQGILSGVVILVSLVGRAGAAASSRALAILRFNRAVYGANLASFDRGAALSSFDRGAATAPQKPEISET